MKETKLSLALLDQIIICGQCGALFLAIGWSNQTHNEWHRSLSLESETVDGAKVASVVLPVRGE